MLEKDVCKRPSVELILQYSPVRSRLHGIQSCHDVLEQHEVSSHCSAQRKYLSNPNASQLSFSCQLTPQAEYHLSSKSDATTASTDQLLSSAASPQVSTLGRSDSGTSLAKAKVPCPPSPQPASSQPSSPHAVRSPLKPMNAPPNSSSPPAAAEQQPTAHRTSPPALLSPHGAKLTITPSSYGAIARFIDSPDAVKPGPMPSPDGAKKVRCRCSRSPSECGTPRGAIPITADSSSSNMGSSCCVSREHSMATPSDTASPPTAASATTADAQLVGSFPGHRDALHLQTSRKALWAAEGAAIPTGGEASPQLQPKPGICRAAEISSTAEDTMRRRAEENPLPSGEAHAAWVASGGQANAVCHATCSRASIPWSTLFSRVHHFYKRESPASLACAQLRCSRSPDSTCSCSDCRHAAAYQKNKGMLLFVECGLVCLIFVGECSCRLKSRKRNGPARPFEMIFVSPRIKW